MVFALVREWMNNEWISALLSSGFHLAGQADASCCCGEASVG